MNQSLLAGLIRTLRTRYVLGAGFAVVLGCMLMLAWVGLENMADARLRLDHIASIHYDRLRIVTDMYTASRERTINLQKLILLSDPFEHDEQLTQFNRHGGDFILLRERLLAMELSSEEQNLLAEQARRTRMAVPLQREVIELVSAQRVRDAHRLLVEKAIPAQDRVLETLQALVEYQRNEVSAAVTTAREGYQRARMNVMMLSGLILLLGVGVALGAIRESRRTDRALREEKERAQVTLHSLGEGVIRTDASGAVEYINPVAERLTGWAAREALGRPFAEVFQLVHDSTRQPLGNPARLALERGAVVGDTGDGLLVTRREEEYAIEHTATPVRDGSGEVVGAVVVFRDVTEVRALSRELVYQASHDAMTGLLNRREFERRLRESLEAARAHGQRSAVCYLDLDLFKAVNDTCGHLAGDELLKQLSLILRRRVRREDVLARVGGDEFAVLLRDCPLEKAEQIAEEIRKAMRDFRFVWDDKRLEVGASIGVVQVSDNSGDVNDVLRAADVACRIAKEEGRNRIHLYQVNDLTVSRREREIDWMQRINEALRSDGFVLYGQWIRPLGRHRHEAPHCEVLLHLGDHDKPVSTAAFLSAAERYHLMPAVDRWVINAVFKSLRDGVLDEAIGVNINLSGQSLADPEFLPFVRRAIQQSGVAPRRLCFEITETAAITHMSRALQLMETLKAAGCRLALDDFGSGLSSFSYLRNMPVDYLKIDGAFVRNIVGDATDLAMVSSINQVAHIMGIATVGEYAETDAIIEVLETIGVDYAQGFAVGKPVPFLQLRDERLSVAPAQGAGG